MNEAQLPLVLKMFCAWCRHQFRSSHQTLNITFTDDSILRIGPTRIGRGRNPAIACALITPDD